MLPNDDAGNILSKKEYAYTTGTLGTVQSTIYYSYGNAEWGDLLTTYGGSSLPYDANGNLLADSNWTYTWKHGRQLANMCDDTDDISFTYDANGMRKTKSNGGTTFTYTYNGSQLTQMTCGTDVLDFYYDASGTPVAFKHNGTFYYYVTTLQGDVLLILDVDGDIVVSYGYDAWGEILTIGGSMADTLGTLNPLTYRGYVYDHETRLYYLQSRYYNPEWGRFLNADALIATGQGMLGNNMFAYCRNNPVCRVDISGTADAACFDIKSDDDIEIPGEEGLGNGGYANAYNPIDAGYSYSVDLSRAANSSVWGGGLYSEGYTAYGNHSNPGGASEQTGNSRFTPDQQAVLELARENKNGVTQGEAEILVGFANEYGISNHGPMKHQGRSGIWGYTLHIKIKNYHIEVFTQELN